MASHPCSDPESSPLLTYSHIGLALQTEDVSDLLVSKPLHVSLEGRGTYLEVIGAVLLDMSRSIYRQIPVISCTRRADK